MLEPILDTETLNESVMGDRDLLITVIASFKEDGTTQLQRIEAAIAHADASELKKAGHRLRGAAAALGLQRVQTLAAEMESAGERGEAGRGATIVELLKREFQTACAALDQFHEHAR